MIYNAAKLKGLSSKVMLKQIPNLLTISRVIIIPFILIAMLFDYKASHQIAAILFAYACITDFLDGLIARVYSAQSSFGRFLDPIADKLLVGSVILVLVYSGKAGLFPSIAIICREILVSGLREFLAQIRVSIPVSSLSKAKTLLQMVGILLLVYGNKGSGLDFIDPLGNIVLWIAALLTLFTGYVYLKESHKHFLTNTN